MKRSLPCLAGTAARVLAAACAAPGDDMRSDSSGTTAEGNLLLAEWTGPHGGVPAFDRMDLDQVKPALEAGMEENLEEIEAIARSSEPPTFENTIEAMEASGRDLDRVFTSWGIWSSNLSTSEFREIQEEMASKISGFRSEIIQNADLFQRIKTVYESEEMERLRPDQQRLAWLIYNRFALNGATLEGEAKERYAEIDKKLAELHTKFANNVLADEEGYVSDRGHLSPVRG